MVVALAPSVLVVPVSISTTVWLAVIAGFDIGIVGVHVGAGRNSAQGHDCGSEERVEKHDEVLLKKRVDSCFVKVLKGEVVKCRVVCDVLLKSGEIDIQTATVGDLYRKLHVFAERSSCTSLHQLHLGIIEPRHRSLCRNAKSYGEALSFIRFWG